MGTRTMYYDTDMFVDDIKNHKIIIKENTFHGTSVKVRADVWDKHLDTIFTDKETNIYDLKNATKYFKRIKSKLCPGNTCQCSGATGVR